MNVTLTMSQQEAVRILGETLDKVKTGEIVGVAVVSEQYGGSYWFEHSSKYNNNPSMAGFLLKTALNILGIKPNYERD